MTIEQGPVFFWREFHPQWDFLSNWYISPFHTKDKEQVFRSMEQYFMYQKAMLFKDTEIAVEIMKYGANPKKCKSLGRKVKLFDTKKWEKEREKLIEEGLYYKFTNSLAKHEDLKAKLLATEDRELVEASPFDRIWGVGFDEAHAEASRAFWGLNLLGKLTMNVRQKIREEEEAKQKEATP